MKRKFEAEYEPNKRQMSIPEESLFFIEEPVAMLGEKLEDFVTLCERARKTGLNSSYFQDHLELLRADRLEKEKFIKHCNGKNGIEYFSILMQNLEEYPEEIISLNGITHWEMVEKIQAELNSPDNLLKLVSYFQHNDVLSQVEIKLEEWKTILQTLKITKNIAKNDTSTLKSSLDKINQIIQDAISFTSLVETFCAQNVSPAPEKFEGLERFQTNLIQVKNNSVSLSVFGFSQCIEENITSALTKRNLAQNIEEQEAPLKELVTTCLKYLKVFLNNIFYEIGKRTEIAFLSYRRKNLRAYLYLLNNPNFLTELVESILTENTLQFDVQLVETLFQFIGINNLSKILNTYNSEGKTIAHKLADKVDAEADLSLKYSFCSYLDLACQYGACLIDTKPITDSRLQIITTYHARHTVYSFFKGKNVAHKNTELTKKAEASWKDLFKIVADRQMKENATDLDSFTLLMNEFSYAINNLKECFAPASDTYRALLKIDTTVQMELMFELYQGIAGEEFSKTPFSEKIHAIINDNPTIQNIPNFLQRFFAAIEFSFKNFGFKDSKKAFTFNDLTFIRETLLQYMVKIGNEIKDFLDRNKIPNFHGQEEGEQLYLVNLENLKKFPIKLQGFVDNISIRTSRYPKLHISDLVEQQFLRSPAF